MTCEREGCGQTTKKGAGSAPCISCSKACPADHGGITCIGGCNVCLECSPTLVRHTFDQSAFPLRCSSCRQPLVIQSFERQLTTEQLSIFLLFMMQTDERYISSEEEIQSCPFCNYWQLSTKDPGRLMFFCKNSLKCGKVSCVWCKKRMRTTVIRFDDRSSFLFDDDNEDSKQQSVTESQFQSHQICAEIGPLKARWDEAIKQGSGTACPGCGMVISKSADGACTHMTCTKCRTVFCYLCGLSESDCDKGRIRGAVRESIMQHQIDWKKNPKRCPMYLYELGRLDDRYAGMTEQGILDTLHRQKTQMLLQQRMTEFKKAGLWTKLLSRYDLGTVSGFDLEELAKGKFELIRRRKPGDAAAD